jgi:hypothetical protein
MQKLRAVIYFSLVMMVTSSGYAADCNSASKVFTFAGGMAVYHTDDTPATIFRGLLTIDADGAPDAYCPAPLKGRDFLANAGTPGNWFGVVTDAHGVPFVQGPTDPKPDCYVSATSLEDVSKASSDPVRYVDSATIPYIALPGRPAAEHFKRDQMISLGDIVVVYNAKTETHAFAIYADIAPGASKGEGSIRLAEMLGVPNTSPKNGGLSTRELLFVVFPRSGNGRAQPASSIVAIGAQLLAQWGGVDRLKACATKIE